MFNFMKAKEESNKSMMNNQEILNEFVNEFYSSEDKEWMEIGERYYKVNNDIKFKRNIKEVDGTVVEETYKANNKLAHAKIKNLVDEKIAHLLAKEYTLKCEDITYLDKVKNILGCTYDFSYILTGLGYEASNKGIAWLQIYIDEVGKLNFMIIPSEQCIPIWTDLTHTKLQAMIRVYNQVVYEGKIRKVITRVQYWTEEGVEYYIRDNNMIKVDPEGEILNSNLTGHYQKGDIQKSFGRVPFIPFKNNRIEYPDIRFIKSLIDNYDSSRSEAANYIEDVKNLIFVLKGYGGESINEFMRDLNKNRAINIDDGEDGGVDTINPTMDITAVKEHYEQLKRDIIEDGQGVNKDLDKFGSAPSGVALKFLYQGLDLKCDALEVEFRRGFKQLLYFINIYLQEINQGTYLNIDVDIIFNRDMQMNETEVISNCSNSMGIISDETIIANHPWVKDVEYEMVLLKKQKEELEPIFDNVPIEKEGEITE